MKTLRMFGSIAVASLLAFGLAACGDDNPSGSKDDDSSSSVVEECDGDDCDEDSGKSSDSKDDGKSSSSKKDEKSSSSSAEGPSVVSKGEVKDSRDGKVYKTVKIVAQTWMAENLNVDVEGAWCYDNDPANCEKYGRLYTWKAAMNACPAGWHLPSDAEFKSLLAAVGTFGNERSLNLRADSWKNGTDKFGFSALPAGYYVGYYEQFDDLGSSADFWTSTEVNSGHACYLGISDYYAGVDNVDAKSDGISVRCLQD